MGRAIEERRRELSRPIRLVQAPISYVAGEATAAVNFINTGDARPTNTPPRVSERGVGGAPTLVQNVESLAYAALIARFGDGVVPVGGTVRVSRHGTDHGHRRRIRAGRPGDRARHDVGEVATDSGARAAGIQAVVLGGYFGTWAPIGDVWDLPLDPAVMKAHGLTFGCGIVGLLPTDVCGVSATAEIIGFLADESAGQCGPCVHGLRAIKDATRRVADGAAGGDEIGRIERWTSHVDGRGACHHPDGAAQLMVSALERVRRRVPPPRPDRTLLRHRIADRGGLGWTCVWRSTGSAAMGTACVAICCRT